MIAVFTHWESDSVLSGRSHCHQLTDIGLRGSVFSISLRDQSRNAMVSGSHFKPGLLIYLLFLSIYLFIVVAILSSLLPLFIQNYKYFNVLLFVFLSGWIVDVLVGTEGESKKKKMYVSYVVYAVVCKWKHLDPKKLCMNTHTDTRIHTFVVTHTPKLLT